MGMTPDEKNTRRRELYKQNFPNRTPEQVARKKAQDKKYQQDNIKTKREYNKQYRLDNLDVVKGYQKKYADKTKDIKSATEKARYYKNKPSIALRHKENHMRHRVKDSERNRKNHLLKEYGLTIEAYNDMFNKQDGKCAICGKHQNDLNLILRVDHDHITDAVRGLLCMKCNSGIGHLNDDPILLQKAIEYLSKNK